MASGKKSLYLMVAVLLGIPLAVITYLFTHNQAVLHKYFTITDLRIINVHEEYSSFGKLGYLLFNVNAKNITADEPLVEEKCTGMNGWVPLTSIFYKPSEDESLQTMVERQKKLQAGLIIKCYQTAKDVGRGFPVIETLFDKATGNATIEFPFQFK